MGWINPPTQPAIALEIKPRPRTIPFPDFRRWGSGGPKKAPKPYPAAPKPKVVPKPIDPQSALGAPSGMLTRFLLALPLRGARLALLQACLNGCIACSRAAP